MEAELRSLMEGAPRVHWLGFRKDVPSLMKAFDVLVAPFHREGFGLVIAEAMAVAVPVVASRGGALQELMDDGVEGRLVPVGDAAALAAATIQVASDRALRERLGAAGRLRVQRDFTWERVIRDHEEMLAELVGRTSRADGGRFSGGRSARPGARASARGTPRTASGA
jgi:glycosyltransferase involved in cell wall biosynthesis